MTFRRIVKLFSLSLSLSLSHSLSLSLSLSLSGAKQGLDVIRAVNKEQGHTARAARSFAPRPPPYRHPQILGWRYQHFTACVFSMQSSL